MKTVIEMAREAKLPEAWISETGVLKWSDLERFSEVVRADAIAQEREACAKVCEAYTDNDGGIFIDHEGHGYNCAAAIRARGHRSDETSLRSNT